MGVDANAETVEDERKRNTLGRSGTPNANGVTGKLETGHIVSYVELQKSSNNIRDQGEPSGARFSKSCRGSVQWKSVFLRSHGSVECTHTTRLFCATGPCWCKT